MYITYIVSSTALCVISVFPITKLSSSLHIEGLYYTFFKKIPFFKNVFLFFVRVDAVRVTKSFAGSNINGIRFLMTQLLFNRYTRCLCHMTVM